MSAQGTRIQPVPVNTLTCPWKHARSRSSGKLETKTKHNNIFDDFYHDKRVNATRRNYYKHKCVHLTTEPGKKRCKTQQIWLKKQKMVWCTSSHERNRWMEDHQETEGPTGVYMAPKSEPTMLSMQVGQALRQARCLAIKHASIYLKIKNKIL